MDKKNDQSSILGVPAIGFRRCTGSSGDCRIVSCTFVLTVKVLLFISIYLVNQLT